MNDLPAGYMNKSIPLEINSCGTYRLDAGNEMETCRPKGRVDYQLIYISAGKGYFYFRNSMRPVTVDAGNFVLYHPDEFQKYEYRGDDHADIYWIHFTGADIDANFRKYGLDSSQSVFSSGIKSFYSQSFDQIILELQLQKEFFADASVLLFSHILMMLGRSHGELSRSRPVPPDEVEEVVVYFHEHYPENIHIEEFLVSRGYGVSSFFRKFKAATGVSPLQYLLQIRLTNAMKLLETTNFPISEIARLTGYENALYFSRLFHKHTGVSPREYRNGIRGADAYSPITAT
jgi:AraC family transcriptional regulator of arabinose operon